MSYNTTSGTSKSDDSKAQNTRQGSMSTVVSQTSTDPSGEEDTPTLVSTIANSAREEAKPLEIKITVDGGTFEICASADGFGSWKCRKKNAIEYEKWIQAMNGRNRRGGLKDLDIRSKTEFVVSADAVPDLLDVNVEAAISAASVKKREEADSKWFRNLPGETKFGIIFGRLSSFLLLWLLYHYFPEIRKRLWGHQDITSAGLPPSIPAQPTLTQAAGDDDNV
jgi:hypothetical protein